MESVNTEEDDGGMLFTVYQGCSMNHRKLIRVLAISWTIMTCGLGIGNDYIIYSITQDFPMGTPQEILKKNFYVNIGKKQGVAQGTVLEVYRTITRNDPYKDKLSYNHSVKIGELKVLHTEEENAITSFNSELASNPDAPHFEINKFMIGDKIAVKVSN